MNVVRGIFGVACGLGGVLMLLYGNPLGVIALGAGYVAIKGD